jgi:UDP-N-acetylmuramoylalanine--D-glutamate ligase
MMTKQFFKNKRITVFGLGLNGGGVSTVRFLAKYGVKEIIVTDIKQRSELTSSIEAIKGIKNITYVLGQHRPEDFTRVDMVIINPGIAWTNEYVRLALKKNILVEMDASLFFQLCDRPIIGITGTKGKTTTATLVADILQTAGHHVVRAGIGQIPVLDVLENLKKTSVVVFELSSWRLSSLEHIRKSPHIGIFTNVFPDHLNYYKNMDGYVRDKKNIFVFQTKKDWLIVNQDNETVRETANNAQARILKFSEHTAPDREGIWVEDNAIQCLIGDTRHTIMTLDEIIVLGKHNLSNILAALGGALAYGVDVKILRKVVMNFSGVAHRLEYVRTKDGIDYYNDTAATMPQATIMALQSFTKPIVLIAGGNNKGLDFSELSASIVKYSKDVVFFKGEATEKIIKAMRQYLPEARKEITFEIVESMGDALRSASNKAQAGDVVLLSPGAASFGLFKNEFDRGDQFCAAVKKL